ncbi:Tannase and feruloyl esterase [Ruegeria atlantica]|uniref:Tannase and feruloyl esterase n=2 Tax=Ruegeria atlantica TaxID=81569 RepID=A0A0N7LR26_9RHOB|nr:Tannase and feruloyl esterase [Ruegeria atlantica]
MTTKSAALSLFFMSSAIAIPTTSMANQCENSSFSPMPDVTLIVVAHEVTPKPHCQVVGVIGTETEFELLLPDDWNGKFIMGGSGGFAGNFDNAANDYFNVVADGWATVSTDTGHKGSNIVASWALNNLERQVSFGFQAVHRTAVTSKAIIADYYGSESQRNLFFGCSRGGGQALMAAQRSPAVFDGIYAGAPAYSWTKEMAGRWTHDAQVMYPDPNQITTPVIDAEALAVLGRAIMDQCDALDGLEDGILNDPRQCDFDIGSLTCGESETNQCLSPEQVAAAKAIHGEAEFGGVSWPGTPMGVELPGNPLGWLVWISGGYVEGGEIDFHPGSEQSAFEEPPIPNATWGFATQMMKYFFYNDPEWTYEGYDFSDYAHHAERLSPTLDADDPDLSEFRAGGGKLIIDNGWMDGSLTAYGTIDYYDSVLKFDPSARDDVRLFVRPGVTHCRGGPGPDGTNYIAALEDWLDSGVAPDQLDAPYVDPLTREPNGKGGRIICAHPAVVTYDGSGDPNEPKSFSCQVPG